MSSIDDIELEAFDDDQGDEEEGAEVDDPGSPDSGPTTAPQTTSTTSPGQPDQPTTTGPTVPPMTPPAPPRGSFLRALAWSAGLIFVGVGLSMDLEERYEYDDGTGGDTGPDSG